MLRRGATRLTVALPRSIGPLPFEHNKTTCSVAAPTLPDLDTLVLNSATTSALFGRSASAAVTSSIGFGLFCFTFGFNVGKPVYDAYTREDGDDDNDDDEDKES